MNNITLKQLRYFEALAHHRHFGHAAEASSISQPALSVQIKELEETLGAVLFERAARQVRLTSIGEDFGARVRKILAAVDELGDMARSSKDGMVGRLRIGVIPTIAPYVLPRLIGNLKKSNAEMDIHVRETLTPKLIEELLAGKLDAAVLALPVSESSFTEIALFTEKFVLVRPERDANQPVPESEDLQHMRLLLLEEGHCFRDQALTFCNVPSARPWDGLDGSSLSTLVQMVGAGIGVTLIPEMAVPVETRSAQVAISRLKKPEPSRTVGMIWRKTSPLAPQLLQISRIVKASAQGTGDNSTQLAE